MGNIQRIVSLVPTGPGMSGLVGVRIVRMALEVSVEREPMVRRVPPLEFMPMNPSPVLWMKVSKWSRGREKKEPCQLEACYEDSGRLGPH